MGIVNNIDITLFDHDLRNMIIEQLAKEGYDAKKENIEFKVKRDFRGYGPSAHEVYLFDKCIIKNAKRK